MIFQCQTERLGANSDLLFGGQAPFAAFDLHEYNRHLGDKQGAAPLLHPIHQDVRPRRFGDEFKPRVLPDLLAPNSRPVMEVCQKYGISSWSACRRKSAAGNGTLERGPVTAAERRLNEKLALLLEREQPRRKASGGRGSRRQGSPSAPLALFAQEIRQTINDKEYRRREEIEQLCKGEEDPRAGTAPQGGRTGRDGRAGGALKKSLPSILEEEDEDEEPPKR